MVAAKRQRQATQKRRASAVERANNEGVQVRQLSGSGAWIATRGSNSSATNEQGATGEVADH